MANKSYWPPRNHQNYGNVVNPSGSEQRTTQSGRSQASSVNSGRPTSPTVRRSTNMEAPLTGGKRKTIGGRGREWASHCHKLLESMRELDDSEYFRNPVDILKYKDYYNVVKNHIDFSQVLMKLHGGKYDDPEEFGEDIKLIFDNWKLYCKDPKRHYQVYQAVHKLSWWFDVEFGKIMDNWRVNNRSASIPKRMRTSATSSPAPMPVSPVPARSVIAPGGQDTNILVSIQNGNLSIFHQNQSKTEASSSARTSTVTRMNSTDHLLADSPLSPAPMGIDSNLKMELKMESTSIWFGPCRSKPQRPVLLNEEGFTVYLNAQDGKEHSFVIKSCEIVRCCGHLGKNKKHTLFIFITPPCEKRLKEMSLAHNVFSAKPDREPCSIIAMFIKSLDSIKSSKLVYLFWIMGRANIFGPLFSEVDQKGALSILANIKPQIMGRVQERVTHPSDGAESSSSKRSSDSFTFKSTKKSSSSKDETSPAATATTAVPKPDSPAPPPDRVAEPLPSPGPREGGNPSRARVSSADGRQRTSPEGRKAGQGAEVPESPLSPQHAEEQCLSEDDDLAIIEDPNETTGPSSAAAQPVSFTIDDDAEDVVIAEEHFSVKCPITQLTMTCPVRNMHCKHNYDRVGVQQLITNRGAKARCPVPGCSNAIPLNMLNMELDCELKAFIDSRK